MTIDSVQTIAQKAYDLVAQTPDKTMIGSRLGALLKLEFPDFSPLQFRTRNLRQFVKAHVPSLLERPNAGVDILFTAVDEQPVTPGSASVFTATSSNARPPFVRLPTSTL